MSALVRFMQLGPQASFVGGLQALKESGAAVVKIAVAGDDDHPLAAMIIVRGKGEASEVIRCVDEIEARWSDPEKATHGPIGALKRAEEFIAGFEGDPAQDGVDALLREIRSFTKGGAS